MKQWTFCEIFQPSRILFNLQAQFTYRKMPTGMPRTSLQPSLCQLEGLVTNKYLLVQPPPSAMF